MKEIDINLMDTQLDEAGEFDAQELLDAPQEQGEAELEQGESESEEGENEPEESDNEPAQNEDESEESEGELEQNLVEAIIESWDDEVRQLINDGADVNACVRGQHPLTFAVHQGDTEVVKFLLESGADVNKKNPGDSHYTSSEYTALHLATQFKDIAIMELLISNKADVNARDEQGNTPLHWIYNGIEVDCVNNSSPQEAMNLLIANGANPNLANNTEKTALDYAVDIAKNYDDANDDGNIVVLLIANGAIVKDVNHDLVNQILQNNLKSFLTTKILEQENFQSVHNLFGEVKGRFEAHIFIKPDVNEMLENMFQEFKQDIGFLCGSLLNKAENLLPLPLQEMLNMYEDDILPDQEAAGGQDDKLVELIDSYYRKFLIYNSLPDETTSIQDKLEFIKDEIHQINLNYLDQTKETTLGVILLQQVYSNMTCTKPSQNQAASYVNNVELFVERMIQEQESQMMLGEDSLQELSCSSLQRQGEELDENLEEEPEDIILSLVGLKRERSESDDEENVLEPNAPKRQVYDFYELSFGDFLDLDSDEDTDILGSE